MTTIMTPAIFTVDGENNYSGYHNPGETWNGFACPYFEREEVVKIIEAINADDSGMRLSIEGEVITLKDDDYPDDAPDTCDGQMIYTAEGHKFVFALGAWAWVWSVAEDEAEDLFEHLDQLPKKVRNAIEKMGDDCTYENCRALEAKLKTLGYTFEWGLDAIPYNLRKL